MRWQIAIVAAAALTGAAVSASAVPARAGEQGDPGSCDGGTPEMVDCLNAKAAHWDKELTMAYRQALKDAVPEQREPLRQAERAWIKYRDANCAYYAAGEGTIARIDAAECLRRMTQARALELSTGNAPGPDKPGNEDRD
jgi:uncharacterized protein YecT (DUF1311 family)